MPVKNPQEHQDKFTEEQLRAVDSIYVESTDFVDLDAAERIGLITDDTRAKIEEALGADHVEILKTARDRILTEGSPAMKESLSDSEKRRVALKLAFERVYGKFLFEEDYRVGVTEDDARRVFTGKFEEKMIKVLGVEIDKETGIAGRSELMSARRRLLMLGTPKAGKETAIGDAITKKEVEIADIDPTLLSNADEVTASKSFLEYRKLLTLAIADGSEIAMENLYNLDLSPSLPYLERLLPGIGALVSGYKTEFETFRTDTSNSINALTKRKTETEGQFEKRKAKIRKTAVKAFYDDKFTTFSNGFNALISTKTTEIDRFQAVNDADINKQKLEQELADLKRMAASGVGEVTVAGSFNPEDVLEEAFTRETLLSPEEAEKKLEEAIVKINALTLDTALYKADSTPAKLLGEIKKFLATPEAKALSDKDLATKLCSKLDSLKGLLNDKDKKSIENIIMELEEVAPVSIHEKIIRAEEAKAKADEDFKTVKECQAGFANLDGRILSLVKDAETLFSDRTISRKNTIDVKIEDVTPGNFDFMDVKLGSEIATLKMDQKQQQVKPNKETTDEKTLRERRLHNITQRLTALNGGEKDENGERVRGIKQNAEDFHAGLFKFAGEILFLAENGFFDEKYDIDHIKDIFNTLKAKNPKLNGDVTVKELQDVYNQFSGEAEGYLKKKIDWREATRMVGGKFNKKIPEFDKAVKDAENNLSKLNNERKSNEKLSDYDAAKRIMFAVVKKQHPELSLEEQHNLADLILADDVERIQTQKSYKDLAMEGSVDIGEVLNKAEEYNFRWKVSKFKYQVDGKVFEPFKKLKLEDLDNWSKVEKQFTVAGKFDYQVGFFFLAALKNKEFSGGKGSFTIVSKNLEKKLKSIIAERLGVSKRMGDSYVRRLIDDAFNKQLKDSGDLMVAHFDNYDRERRDIGDAKIKELKHRMKELNEKRKLKKIDQEQYEEKYADILKEAREYGVSDSLGFCQDAELHGYLNSPEAQWVKDLGVDVGRYAKDKAWALTKGTAQTAVNATVGTVKAGASLAFQGALTPLRLVKYPVFLAVKPIAGFINLFRTNKLNSPQIIATARQDIGRVGNYFKTMGTESLKGAKSKTAEAYSKPWSEAQFKRVKYADRTKVNLEDETTRIKELNEKADLKPIEISVAPVIDFDAIRAKIEENDKITGGKAKLENPKDEATKNLPGAANAETSASGGTGEVAQAA